MFELYIKTTAHPREGVSISTIIQRYPDEASALAAMKHLKQVDGVTVYRLFDISSATHS